MNDVPQQPDEANRIARLSAYRILASGPDVRFDRLARLAIIAFGAPMAAIGIMGASRIWFKARVGIDPPSVPRVGAFCAELLDAAGAMVIPDTHLDPMFHDAPLVRSPPHVRFYAGVPIRTRDGLHLGSLCVMDSQPRPMPGERRLALLTELAAQAAQDIEAGAETDPQPGTMALSPAGDGSQRNLLAAYAAKSEFLASLSHELRTPLNAIVGYAGLIAGADDTSPATAEHAGEIMAAARHMLALVNDILEYSRLEAGNLPIGWQRVQVGPVVEAALRMVAVFATSRGIQLHRDFAWPEAVTRGDPVRLKQVLLNLLTNAIKFTPRGGRVTVRLGRGPDDRLEIAVIDNGIGIAEADVPKTLTPFGQIVPKEGGQIEGTGLGLPIAKALVERQGGSLSLESELGIGTTVRIHLPALSMTSDAGTKEAGNPAQG